MSMKKPQLLWSEPAAQTTGLLRGQGEWACGVTEGEAPEGAYPAGLDHFRIHGNCTAGAQQRAP